MDEEARRYAAIIKAKQDRLFQLNRQAAQMGMDTPPHIEMERQTLQEEVGMFEVALESPASASASDELGPRGRFAVNYQQNRRAEQRLDLLIRVLEMFGRLFILVGIGLLIILVIVVAGITYVVTKGGL